MLPAISAELPGYLVPPSATSRESPTTNAPGFGPATNLELTSEAAREALSKKPGMGLYGPDGRFVDPTHRRTADAQPRRNQETPPDSTDSGQPPNTPATNKSQTRDLPLDAVDSAVPPAERAELKRLADRISRRTDSRPQSATDYRKIADLMERVGRYDQARAAHKRAAELDPEFQTRDDAEKTPTRDPIPVDDDQDEHAKTSA